MPASHTTIVVTGPPAAAPVPPAEKAPANTDPTPRDKRGGTPDTKEEAE